MNKFALLAAAAVILLAAWLLLRGPAGEGEESHEPTAAAPEKEPPAPPPLGAAQRHEVPGSGVRPASAPAVPPAVERGESAGELTIAVFARETGAPITGFRTVVRGPGLPRRDEVHPGALTKLALPLEQSCELCVEADGFLPSPPQPVVLTLRQPRQHLRISLEPAVRAAGIVLTVTGPDGAPAPNLRVRLQRFDPAAQQAPPEQLWERITSESSGIYTLPDVHPGRYRLRIAACDPQGELLTHRVHVQELEFHGGEQLPVPVRLAAGAQLSVEALDATGAPLGTEVLARLLRDGTPLVTRWRTRTATGTLLRQDALPAAQPCALEEPIAPGNYELEYARTGGRPERVPCPLPAGVVTPLRVTLRE